MAEHKLVQTFMGVPVTCKNEEDPFQNEGAREVTIDLPFKVLADFYDAQGKLTPQSEVGFTLNSNSSKLLWLSLLPTRMKKIQSNMKALEWSQQCYIIHLFLRCSRAAYSLIGDGILTKFTLIQAFMVVLLICKNEYDLFKFESTSVVTTFLSL